MAYMRKKNPKPCHLTQADRSKGGFAAGVKRRQRALERIAGLSPVQIFRMGYAQGWHQGVRRERRRIGRAA